MKGVGHDGDLRCHDEGRVERSATGSEAGWTVEAVGTLRESWWDEIERDRDGEVWGVEMA